MSKLCETSECKRKVLVVPRAGKKRSRKAKAGNPVYLRDHTLCFRCWERFNDSMRRAG